jgi:RNA polymerase sigma-70 factor (ECF subfamily)
MKRYADGDRYAFEQLFRRYESIAYRFFLQRSGSPERARDQYQELFLRIHRARESFDCSRSFRPWLFQIARRLVFDHAEHASRARETEVDDREARSEEPDTDERVATREQLQMLLARLSPEERYLVLASKLEGVGYDELAARLQKSVSAVKKAVSRALGRMRVAAAESLVTSPPKTCDRKVAVHRGS